MIDIDEMEKFWTMEINNCLDVIAPWKIRKIKQKRFSLPNEVQNKIKKKKELQRRHQINVQLGKVDFEIHKNLKKQSNFCNKMIKKEVRANMGKNITDMSSVNEVWNCINDILKPENSSKSNLKIETENQLIEDPHELAEKFDSFF